MNDLARHVETNIREKGLFRERQRILVAASGGVDSMVLLALLGRKWKVTVAHFNHQLRGASSNADERLVRGAARKLKAPFVTGRGNVRQFAQKSGLSLEMAGRKLRHEFLAATALKLKIPTIALAHHADDQVELFFLRLLRGAGSEGLAGMKWANPSPASPKIKLARPLLDVPKAVLLAFAKENEIAFAEDVSNASIDIQRNRVRHELIPLLTRHYQPALSRTILRQMEITGADAEFVGQAAREWTASGRRPAFREAPKALQRRLIHQQLIERKLAPDFDLIERLRLAPGQKITINALCALSLDATGTLRLHGTEQTGFGREKRELLLSGPNAKHEITFGRLRICWEIADNIGMALAGKKADSEFFDADKVGAPVCLRCWQPGDRFQPIGTGSPRKLQDLFTNLKVPQAERRRRVVAATRQGELFWVEGLRMAEKFKLDENTVRQLKWSWSRI